SPRNFTGACVTTPVLQITRLEAFPTQNGARVEWNTSLPSVSAYRYKLRGTNYQGDFIPINAAPGTTPANTSFSANIGSLVAGTEYVVQVRTNDLAFLPTEVTQELQFRTTSVSIPHAELVAELVGEARIGRNVGLYETLDALGNIIRVQVKEFAVDV